MSEIERICHNFKEMIAARHKCNVNDIQEQSYADNKIGVGVGRGTSKPTKFITKDLLVYYLHYYSPNRNVDEEDKRIISYNVIEGSADDFLKNFSEKESKSKESKGNNVKEKEIDLENLLRRFPKFDVEDPVVRYYNALPGDIVKIHRSNDHGNQVYYRYIENNQNSLDYKFAGEGAHNHNHVLVLDDLEEVYNEEGYFPIKNPKLVKDDPMIEQKRKWTKLVQDYYKKSNNCCCEVFFASSLMFNIVKHKLVPKHEIIRRDNAKQMSTFNKEMQIMGLLP
jgi:DNA-directed RNA polymerase subunit H (RpoH/RPB5)